GALAPAVGDGDALELDVGMAARPAVRGLRRRRVGAQRDEGHARLSLREEPGMVVIAAVVCSALRTCGGGMRWIVCTERPQPRVSGISCRSRMTKRPRTRVWTGRPFTRRPFHGVIFARDWSLASSIVHSRARSTIAMSASAPGWMAPFFG